VLLASESLCFLASAMVIKLTFVHSGRSYGNGDDQYDNESLGSTRTVFTSEKLMKNSSSNKKNEKVEIIGSRNKDKHIEEHGWTKIGTNSNRKPKTKNEKQTSIDSIITTININPRIVKQGAPEAQIDSPIRYNRCTLPDKTNKKEGEEIRKEQRTRPLEQPKGEEIREDSAVQFTAAKKEEND
jgi:hypothetical protein